MEGLGDIFANPRERDRQDQSQQIEELHAKIGELTVGRDFFQKAQALSRPERVAMITREYPD